jgi:hypothetical protein
LAAILGLVAVYGWYTIGIGSNPPGFYTDESAFAFNAHVLGRTGRDFNGVVLPLYTTFYGGAMNMPFIYLLAAVYDVTGPSIVVARLVAATLAFGAAAVLGVLAYRRSGRSWIGVVVGAAALLTPQIFENGRLVFEVATFPLALALLLLALHRAHVRGSWSWIDAIAIAASLALVTYGYTIGRLLGPALAAALILFVRPAGRQSLLRTWLVFGVLLVPLFVFNAANPGWLTGRFNELTYVNAAASPLDIVTRFVAQYLGNIDPRRLLIIGDLNARHHVPGSLGPILAGVLGLALVGAGRLILLRGVDAWWRFVLVGTVLSIVPASLLTSEFHSLRLVGLPVFLLVLAIAGLQYLAERLPVSSGARVTLVGLLGLIVAQSLYFQVRFHEAGPHRGHWLDEGYPAVLEAALETGAPRVYLVNGVVPGQFHAYWYGTLNGIDPGHWVEVPDSKQLANGSYVISSENECTGCEVIIRAGFFMLYRVA